MSIWSAPESPARWCCALVLLLTAPGPGARGAQASSQDDVASLFADGRYGAALTATADIDDPALRAEWRFHLLFTGGDLPAALRAARRGLEQVPEHPGLLGNAAHCATLLGLGEEALAFAQRLAALPPPPGEDADQAAARIGRAERLAAAAALVADLEAAGRRGGRRALLIALGGLTAAVAALVALAARPVPTD